MGFAIDSTTRRWPDGRMPYEIDESAFPPGSDDHNSILKAIAHWNTYTVMTLVPRVAETDYVVFVAASASCSSFVGRLGGRQEVRCDVASSSFDTGSVIHEIGHAAGLYHEQQRPDRDDFITVNTDNIQEGKEHNFDIRESGLMLGEYDYGSIMHYPRRAFAKNAAIDTITPPAGVSIGQRDKLSGGDVWGICQLYGNSDFAIVWEDDKDRNNFYQIKMASFNRTGRRCSGDITVNSVAAGQQFKPQIGLDIFGGTVVVWEDDKDRNGYYQIYARGFNADGTERFSDFTVNSAAAGQQLKPQIAISPFGNFVVVWEDDKDRNGYYQIYARGFNADGSERFSDFTINSVAAGQQLKPQIAMAANGSFVVVWEDDKDGNGYYQIYARGFNADGSELFSDITVNSAGSGQQLKPQVGMAANGNFVVVWEDDKDNNGYYQIYARGFNANGTERFADFTVNSVAAGQQLKPDIAVASDGSFVVVWQDDKDGNGYYQIYARGFSASGAERFSDFTVNTVASGQQLKPKVAIGRGRDFVVVWEDDKDQNGFYEIYARGFTAEGSELFAPIKVNRVSSGQQLKPAIAKRAPLVLFPLPPIVFPGRVLKPVENDVVVELAE